MMCYDRAGIWSLEGQICRSTYTDSPQEVFVSSPSLRKMYQSLAENSGKDTNGLLRGMMPYHCRINDFCWNIINAQHNCLVNIPINCCHFPCPWTPPPPSFYNLISLVGEYIFIASSSLSMRIRKTFHYQTIPGEGAGISWLVFFFIGFWALSWANMMFAASTPPPLEFLALIQYQIN